MKYKLIACDIDETLLNDQKKLTKKNIDAINKARDLGVKFVPATGRNFLSLEPILKELGLYDKEDEYIISFNGGAITENKNNKLIDFNGISFETVKALFIEGLKYDVCIHLFTLDATYTYRNNHEEQDFIERSKLSVTDIDTTDIEFIKDKPFVKVIFQNLNKSYLESIAKEIEYITNDTIEVSYSSNRYIEFNALSVDKGLGLLHLANILNIKPRETIAIGDNLNDLAMIKKAGLGAAVKNAVGEVKEYASYISKLTNDEDAVADIIEKFVL